MNPSELKLIWTKQKEIVVIAFSHSYEIFFIGALGALGRRFESCSSVLTDQFLNRFPNLKLFNLIFFKDYPEK